MAFGEHILPGGGWRQTRYHVTLPSRIRHSRHRQLSVTLISLAVAQMAQMRRRRKQRVAVVCWPLFLLQAILGALPVLATLAWKLASGA